ncbi:MAG TPA: caspase family protein, partial [Polyangiaceae bacterium]
AAGTVRFAIVIGNNRPDETNVSSLRYADDDAVATHRLFLQAGVQSVLLVTLDEDSQRLYQDIGPHMVPGVRQLQAAFVSISNAIRQANEAGKNTELILFFSGHGEVSRGEGYLVLQDGRLTRTKLYSLLAHSPATRNHVFIDACKSFYLAFDKGPSAGERSAAPVGFAVSTLPGELSNTGFVTSTTSDRDSHEWERYQAGIMSHELRSALRGAADVNGDGSVSYRELAAFLSTANRGILNAKYRPDFMVQPPGRDFGSEVLSWRLDPAVVTLQGAAIGHVYIETSLGERILDAHPASGQALTLHVPHERPIFIRRSDESGELVVDDLRPVQVATLDARPPEVGRRGALHLAFEQLFASPFGMQSVSTYQPLVSPGPVQVDPLGHRSSTRSTIGTVAGFVSVGAAAGGLALLAVSGGVGKMGDGQSNAEVSRRNQVIRDLDVTAVVVLSVAGAAGLTWGWTKLWPDVSVSVQTVSLDGGGRSGATLTVSGNF